MVGFGCEDTDKCWREETESSGCIVVGLDLVKVQILIPILPLCLSHPLSSSLVPRKTDLSTLENRKKRDHSSSTPRLWFKVDVSLFSLLVSLPHLSLISLHCVQYVMIGHKKPFQRLLSLLLFIIDSIH